MSKAIRKMLALLLAVTLALTGIPVLAAEESGGESASAPGLGKSGTITGFESVEPVKVEKGTPETDIPFPDAVTANVQPEDESAEATTAAVQVGAWKLHFGTYTPGLDSMCVYKADRDSLILPEGVTLPEDVELPLVRVEVGAYTALIAPMSTGVTIDLSNPGTGGVGWTVKDDSKIIQITSPGVYEIINTTNTYALNVLDVSGKVELNFSNNASISYNGGPSIANFNSDTIINGNGSFLATANQSAFINRGTAVVNGGTFIGGDGGNFGGDGIGNVGYLTINDGIMTGGNMGTGQWAGCGVITIYGSKRVTINGGVMTGGSGSEDGYGINCMSGVLEIGGACTAIAGADALPLNGEAVFISGDAQMTLESKGVSGTLEFEAQLDEESFDRWDVTGVSLADDTVNPLSLDMPANTTVTVDIETTGIAPVLDAPTGPLSEGTVGEEYSTTIGAEYSPTAFTVSAGSLPDGLSIDDSGVISGTPSAAGTFTFSITADNAFGTSAPVEYTITIADAGQEKVIDLSNPQTSTKGWTVTSTPYFISITSPGVYEVINTTTQYSLEVADTGGEVVLNFADNAQISSSEGACLVNRNGDTTINGKGTFLGDLGTDAFINDGTAVVNNGTFTGGNGSSYDHGAGNGIINNRGAILTVNDGQMNGGDMGSGLAAGSGIRTSPGSTSVTLYGGQMTGGDGDSNGNGIYGRFGEVIIGGSCTVIAGKNAIPVQGLVSFASADAMMRLESQEKNGFLSISADFQSGIFGRWIITGITLNEDTESAIMFNIPAHSTVIVAAGELEAPVISTPAGALADGKVGTAYSAAIATDSSPTSFAVSSGSLPAGLSIDDSGVISGTPATAGAYTFSITASNPAGTSTAVQFTIAIAAADVDPEPEPEPVSYVITVSASPSAGGSVSGGGTFGENTSHTVTAAQNSGYSFTGWTENDVEVSTDTSYTFVLTGDRDLVANFALNNVSVEVKPQGNAPATTLPNPGVVQEAVLTPQDLADIQNGSDIAITLEVKEATPPAEDRQTVEENLDGKSVGMYLDISMFKRKDNGAPEAITQLSKSIRIRFAVPAELAKSGRTFEVIRVHDGDVEILPDLSDDPDYIVIETDRFSTYALAYADVAIAPPVQPPVTKPVVRPDSSDSSDSSSSSGRTVSGSVAPTPSNWLEPTTAQSLAGKSTENHVRTKSAVIYGVKKEAWPKLKGYQYQHDTYTDQSVQVRLYISSPEKMTADTYVTGWVRGEAVEKRKAFFEKWFRNQVRVVHLDNTEPWGQEVQIAAKVDLAGMDSKRLYFYSYNKKTNIYTLIEKPRYWIDENGYLHFYTELAGDIIISEGPLERE